MLSPCLISCKLLTRLPEKVYRKTAHVNKVGLTASSLTWKLECHYRLETEAYYTLFGIQNNKKARSQTPYQTICWQMLSGFLISHSSFSSKLLKKPKNNNSEAIRGI